MPVVFIWQPRIAVTLFGQGGNIGTGVALFDVARGIEYLGSFVSVAFHTIILVAAKQQAPPNRER